MGDWLALTVLCVNTRSIGMINCKNYVSMGSEILLQAGVANVICKQAVGKEHWPQGLGTRNEILRQLTIDDGIFLHLLLWAKQKRRDVNPEPLLVNSLHTFDNLIRSVHPVSIMRTLLSMVLLRVNRVEAHHFQIFSAEVKVSDTDLVRPILLEF